MKIYTLSGEQVAALGKLLQGINLEILAKTGEIVGYIDCSPEEGQIIYDLYYDDKFLVR